MKRASFVAAVLLGWAPIAAAQPEAETLSWSERLDQVVERIELTEVPLGDALRLLSEESGLNLVASADSAGIPISCFLLDLSLRQAISAIAKSYGLWYREDEDSRVIRVMTVEEFERDLLLFRDEHTTVYTLLFPNAFDVAIAIRNLFGDRVRVTLDRQNLFDEYQEISQRFQRFQLLEQQAQSLGIFTQGNNGGGLYNNQNQSNPSNAGLFGNGRYSFNQLYASQAPIDRQGLFTQPDQADLTPSQVESLQRALEAGEAIDPELERRLQQDRTRIYVTVIRRSNLIAVRSADDAALKEIEGIIQSLDVPTPQVLLEVKILSLDLSDDFTSAFDFDYQDSRNFSQFSTGDLGQSGPTLDPGALVYQFVDEHFRARLQFLQQNDRVTSVANPLLLVANNEVARLFVGEERPIVRNVSSQTTTNENTSITTPTSTVELRPVGTTLLLTPNVNADRTVTLRVIEESSDVLVAGASIPVVVGDEVISQPIDVVRSRTVTGTVIAKDGHTLALGGLIEEEIQDIQEGIPGLMDLPLVGFLFRRELKTRARRELVVMIRPFVLFTANEAQDISQSLIRRSSIHTASDSMDSRLNTFSPDEVPRSPLGSDPLGEMLQYQSGLPGGR